MSCLDGAKVCYSSCEVHTRTQHTRATHAARTQHYALWMTMPDTSLRYTVRVRQNFQERMPSRRTLLLLSAGGRIIALRSSMRGRASYYFAGLSKADLVSRHNVVVTFSIYSDLCDSSHYFSWETFLYSHVPYFTLSGPNGHTIQRIRDDLIEGAIRIHLHPRHSNGSLFCWHRRFARPHE